MRVLPVGAGLAAATIMGILGTAAHATTVEFASPNWVYNNSGASNQVAWRVEVDDNTDGVLTFNVGIDPGSQATADILALGFDTSLTGLSSTDFTGSDITGIGANTLSCGPGCNFNGDGRTAFDYVVRIGGQGSSSGSLTSTTFTVDVADSFVLAIDSVSRVGIRAQSLGASPNGGGGSAKDVNATARLVPQAPPPPTVPLPAGAWLMLAALGGLGATRMRTRKTA